MHLTSVLHCMGFGWTKITWREINLPWRNGNEIFPVSASHLRENPAEADVPSHQLMLRAGMMLKLAAGIYSYLPLGLRAIRKGRGDHSQEMNRAGAIEVLLPFVQPAEIWQESHRWRPMERKLGRMKDRHNRTSVWGLPTRRVMTDIARKEIRSYRQMRSFSTRYRPSFGMRSDLALDHAGPENYHEGCVYL